MINIINKFKIYPGLGDAVFLYPIAKWLVSKKRIVHIETNFKEIFYELINNPYFFILDNLSYPVKMLNYKDFLHLTNKNIFEDICDIARVPKLDFALDHPGGKINIEQEKYCILKPPYFKYPRHKDIIPNFNFVQSIINLVCKKMPVFMIRHKDDIYNEFENVKLINVSNVSDLIGLIKHSSLAISQHGHFQHIAESFNLPCLVVLSSNMINSKIDTVKKMHVQKIIIGKNTKYIFDNENIEASYENWFD